METIKEIMIQGLPVFRETVMIDSSLETVPQVVEAISHASIAIKKVISQKIVYNLVDQKVEVGQTIKTEAVLLTNVKEMITMVILTKKRQLQGGVEMKYKDKLKEHGEAIKTIIEHATQYYFSIRVL